ncbi:flagellar filament capping protein FliD [Peredibacter starrii]|uniref:Flagellar hook-associated protein 2 n=1 Tax=Peredibacter starrii TaxID=28202 RepID=A0AAX4HQM3_9BACT|nr:flagellar filament capping protein FliD [Peredibacter starrii]WPU65507.1 flagellar filament capping protein FliD [Peredibacter starrii]
MGISFGSINSGLPKDIVQQIVEAEKIPIQQMEVRKGKINDKKSLVQQLTTLVENMRGEVLKNKNARSLRELAINTGDSKHINVTADKNIADPGKYQLEVVQLAQKSSAISNGVEDKDKTYVGVGYIRVNLPNGDEKEIYVDEKHATLSGIAKLINGDSELGIRANVVNDGKDSDEPYRLIVSMTETGDGNRVEFPYLYLVDGEVDIYFEQERPAQDAKVKLDGFEIEVPSNKVTDLIPGVTIDLKKALPGEEINIEITEDVQKIGGKVNSLIDNINNVLKFIKEQNSLDEKTDTQRTLGGDSTLTTIESRVRSAVFTSVMTDAGPMRMGDLGVTFQRDGLLKFDQAKFEQALSKDYKSVSQTLTGKYSLENGKSKGFIDILDETAQTLLSQPTGVLPTRKGGLQSQINQIDRQIANRQRTIAQKEDILKAKFARLEETISKIKGQGAGLAGFAAPPGIQQL